MEENIPYAFFEATIALSNSRRMNLWSRYFCKYTLLREKEKKLCFTESELERTIDCIIDLTEKVQLSGMLFQLARKNIKPSAHEFCKYLASAPFWSDEEIMQYNSLLKDFNEDKREFFMDYEEKEAWKLGVSFREKQVLELPRMKDFLEGCALFSHLETLYISKDRIVNNENIPLFDEIESSRATEIHDHFLAMDKKGWEYAFFNETDYRKYLYLLESFFLNDITKIGDLIIKVRPRTRTKLAHTLGEIYKNQNAHLRSNKEYYKIIRCLNEFKDDSDEVIYRALIR